MTMEQAMADVDARAYDVFARHLWAKLPEMAKRRYRLMAAAEIDAERHPESHVIEERR